jgi:sugar lactone lactonase YvrE
MLRGEVNGAAYAWRPGTPVAMIPGTELSGPNGVELSPDGRFLFLAAFGGRRVVRVDLGPDRAPPASVALDIAPDNLRWTERGTLLTVGNNTTPDTGWTIYEIDAATMTALRVMGVDRNATLQGAATALEVDGEIWIGTFNGDRVGYFGR